MTEVNHRKLNLKSRLKWLVNTPLHPQWFAVREEPQIFRSIGQEISGEVLDIGCADQRIAAYLPTGTRYTGLDYFQTASFWYHTRPQVFGDAHALPFAADRFDAVLLLDVMEHLENPTKCLSEVNAVLRRGGRLMIKVPFLYPMHDSPRDFQRWTKYGLMAMLTAAGFSEVRVVSIGRASETATLLSNLAMSKTALSWIERRHAFAVFVPLIACIILLRNMATWMFSSLSQKDDFMPVGFVAFAVKTSDLSTTNSPLPPLSRPAHN